MAKLSKKIASIAFGDVVGRGISFVTTVYLARILGAESYGLIVIALSYLGYATWFADLGLTHIAGREIAKEPVKRIYRAREIFFLKVTLNLFVLFAMQLIIVNVNLPDEQKEIILSFSYALIPFTFILEWYYNGRQQFGKVASSKILNSTVYLILVVLFIHSNSDLQKVPLIFIGSSSAAALLFLFFSIKEKPFALPYRGFSVIKELFVSAVTIGGGTFFTQTIQLLPPIAIGLLLSNEEAGIYGAAIKVIFIAMLVDRIFVNLLLPNLSAQWVSNKEAAKHNIRFVSRIMISIAGVLSLFIAISSPFIIETLYGDEYQSGAEVLSILSIFLFLTFLNSIFSFGLIAIGKDRQFFNSTLLSGIITLILIFGSATTNNLLIVTFAVSLSELIFVCTSFFWFNKNTQLKIAGPFIISVLLLGSLYYLSQSLHLPVLLEAMGAVVLFIPLTLITGVINIDHLNWFKQKLIS
ncbi:MAG: oligosaccharide flippase family protein [Balneola sp.]